MALKKSTRKKKNIVTETTEQETARAQEESRVAGNQAQKDQLMESLGAYYKKDINDLAAMPDDRKVTSEDKSAKSLVEMVRAIKHLDVADVNFNIDDFINDEDLKHNPYHDKIVKSYNLNKEYGAEGPSWGAMAFPNVVKGNKTDPETGEDIDSNVFEKGLSLFEDVTTLAPRAIYSGVQSLTPNRKNISFAENMATPSEYNSGEQQLMQDLGIGGIGGGLLNKGARSLYGLGKGAKMVKAAKQGEKVLKMGDKVADVAGAAEKVDKSGSKIKRVLGNIKGGTAKVADKVANIGEPTADEIIRGKQYLTGPNAKPMSKSIKYGMAKGVRDNALPSVGVAATKFNNDKDVEGAFELGAGVATGALFGGIGGAIASKGAKAAKGVDGTKGLTAKGSELVNKDYSKRQLADAAKHMPITDSRTGVIQMNKLDNYNTTIRDAIGDARTAEFDKLADVPASKSLYNSSIVRDVKPKYRDDLSIKDQEIFDREIKRVEDMINSKGWTTRGNDSNQTGVFSEINKNTTRLNKAASGKTDPDAALPLKQAARYLEDASNELVEGATYVKPKTLNELKSVMHPGEEFVPIKTGDIKRAKAGIDDANADFKEYYNSKVNIPRASATSEAKQKVLNKVGADRANLATNAASLEDKIVKYDQNMYMLDKFNEKYKLGLDLDTPDFDYIKTGIVNSIRNKMPIQDQRNFMQLFEAAADLSPAVKAGKSMASTAWRGAKSGNQSTQGPAVAVGSLFNEKAQCVAVDPFTGEPIEDEPVQLKSKYEKIGSKVDKAASLFGGR